LCFRGALLARTPASFATYAAVSLLSLIFLYLTKTRSSLLEALVCLIVMLAFSPLHQGRKMVAMAAAVLILGFVALSGVALTTGVVAVDRELDSFRAGQTLADARGGNWAFGIERIGESPMFGEGLLAKQTQGGTRGVDFGSETSYDPRFDPHSLVLSFGVQAGIPFMLAMSGLILMVFGRYLAAFGLRRSLEAPEFLIGVVHFAIMLAAGGDLTALGNLVDKIYWVFLGTMALKAELVLRQRGSIPASRPAARPYFAA
jgi:O-antigen ligase